MRNIIYILFFTFILTMDLTIGKNYNNKKNKEDHHKKKITLKLNDRLKRSFDDRNLLLWTKNKKILNPKFNERIDDEDNNKDIEKDIPFWGSRGRRDSSSVEIYNENATPFEMKSYDKLCENCLSGGDVQNSKERRDENGIPFWGSRGRRNSEESVNSISSENTGKTVPYRDSRGWRLNNDLSTSNRGIQVTLSDQNQVMSEKLPFWGTRGRREFEPFWGSREGREENGSSSGDRGRREESEPFWGIRGRREETEPFWGSRGRRDESEPFWGSRGRREESEPFWGSRGRREEIEPFWGSRGRRKESVPFWGSRGRRQDTAPIWDSRGRREESEPFWGSRGRREESEPFWGSRGRREESEPFWGSRGRRENIEPFWGSRGRREETDPFRPIRGNRLENYENDNFRQSIKKAIADVEDNIKRLTRFRRSDSSCLTSRERNSQISLLSNDARNRYPLSNNIMRNEHATMKYRPSESSTVLDDRVYAEQPSYILVERSGRSSAEDDPYFISRGKKKFRDVGVIQAVRDRRGAIEELVKTVQNDPYFIARGKKDSDLDKTGNLSASNVDLTKAKDLICSTADLILNKSKQHILKREAPDNERSRRTTLKKLAVQLQMDPYFVSRGKKSGIDDRNADKYQDFIQDILEKCYINVRFL